MIDFYFVSLYLLFPVLFYILLKLSGESIFNISATNILFISLFVFSYVGVLPLYFGWDEYRYESGINDKNLIFYVFLCSSCCISCYLSGVIYCKKIINLKESSKNINSIRNIYGMEVFILFLLFLVSLLVCFEYLSRVESVALFAAIAEGSSAGNLARSEMTNNFDGKYHWYKFLISDVSQFLLFSFFAAWLKSKRYVFTLALLFSYSFFVSIMTAEKAPLVWLMIGMLMVYLLVKNNGVVPFRIAFVTIVFSCIILSIAHIYLAGAKNLFEGFSLLFSRAFSGSIAPAYFYLEYFPKHGEFLYGNSFPNPGGILPYAPVSYTVDIMNWKFPELIETGVVGSMPTVFWGEAYANFNWYGIPVLSFLIGFIVAVVAWLCSKLEASPVTIGYFVWLILLLKNLSITGFSEYIFNPYLWSMTLILFFVILSRKVLISYF
jgi:oligosaccharide repeat unit polymerase